jgi:hypothetical protein
MLDAVQKLKADIRGAMAKMTPAKSNFYQHHDIDDARCDHCNHIGGGSLVVALAAAEDALADLAAAIREHTLRAEALRNDSQA